MTKTLTIMLFSGPYSSQYADYACKISEVALDKGYKVNLFLYGDGVHAGMKGQGPKAFLNIGDSLRKIAEKGAEIKSCVRCSTARGYVDGEYLEEEDRYTSSKYLDEIKLSGLYNFIDFIKGSDKIITLGSL
jgi:tRNA 2-thiouridine synthesizing protein D